jgi:lysozyme
MPQIDFEGELYDFPDDATDAEILDFFEKMPQPPADDTPEPVLPQGTPEYIKQNEGFKAKPYKDSLGIRTVGYGFNLQDPANQAMAKKLGVSFNKPLSNKDAEKLFKHSVINAEDAIRNIDPEYDTRPDSVKKALLDMSYNLGQSRLAEFEDMFAAIKAGDYRQAGFAVTKSLYAAQVPVRARNNAKLLMQAGLEASQRFAQQTEQQEQYSEGEYEDEAGNPFYVDADGRINPARYKP